MLPRFSRGSPGAADSRVLEQARREERRLITFDRDFRELASRALAALGEVGLVERGGLPNA
jgi:predicted nuclease of predicted toxin-antitoxin system